MRIVAKALAAVIIGMLLYGALYAYTEQLVYRYGQRNPFYKVATADPAAEHVVILGASHALPLEFGSKNETLEESVGGPVINLAITGGGVIPNSVHIEYLLERLGPERLGTVIYALDSFAFYSSEWNEARLEDVRLWQRAPLDLALIRTLWRSTSQLGVSQQVFWNYLTGFSKVNDPSSWYTPDLWNDEVKFDDRYRPDTWLDQNRVDFLYPEGANQAALETYLQHFLALIGTLQQHDVNILVMKLPLRSDFYELIPGEAQFDKRISSVLNEQDVPFYNYSVLEFDSELFYDPDHLNREGVSYFLQQYLRPVLERHVP